MSRVTCLFWWFSSCSFVGVCHQQVIHDASRRLTQHGSINRYFTFSGEYLGFFRAGSCAFCGDDLGLRGGVQVRANVGDLCLAQGALQQYRQNS